MNDDGEGDDGVVLNPSHTSHFVTDTIAVNLGGSFHMTSIHRMMSIMKLARWDRASKEQFILQPLCPLKLEIGDLFEIQKTTV